MSIDKNERNRDLGLLILRVGIGIMFAVAHGWGKMEGGPERWEGIGGNMKYLGLDFAHVFWGFMAAMAEFIGAILLALGLFTRPAALLLFITMVVAVLRHMIGSGQTLWEASHAAEAAILFFSLILIGPGRYSLDYKWFMSRKLV